MFSWLNRTSSIVLAYYLLTAWAANPPTNYPWVKPHKVYRDCAEFTAAYKPLITNDNNMLLNSLTSVIHFIYEGSVFTAADTEILYDVLKDLMRCVPTCGDLNNQRNVFFYGTKDWPSMGIGFWGGWTPLTYVFKQAQYLGSEQIRSARWPEMDDSEDLMNNEEDLQAAMADLYPRWPLDMRVGTVEAFMQASTRDVGEWAPNWNGQTMFNGDEEEIQTKRILLAISRQLEEPAGKGARMIAHYNENFGKLDKSEWFDKGWANFVDPAARDAYDEFVVARTNTTISDEDFCEKAHAFDLWPYEEPWFGSWDRKVQQAYSMYDPLDSSRANSGYGRYSMYNTTGNSIDVPTVEQFNEHFAKNNEWMLAHVYWPDNRTIFEAYDAELEGSCGNAPGTHPCTGLLDDYDDEYSVVTSEEIGFWQDASVCCNNMFWNVTMEPRRYGGNAVANPHEANATAALLQAVYTALGDAFYGWSNVCRSAVEIVFVIENTRAFLLSNQDNCMAPVCETVEVTRGLKAIYRKATLAYDSIRMAIVLVNAFADENGNPANRIKVSWPWDNDWSSLWLWCYDQINGDHHPDGELPLGSVRFLEGIQWSLDTANVDWFMGETHNANNAPTSKMLIPVFGSMPLMSGVPGQPNDYDGQWSDNELIDPRDFWKSFLIHPDLEMAVVLGASLSQHNSYIYEIQDPQQSNWCGDAACCSKVASSQGVVNVLSKDYENTDWAYYKQWRYFFNTPEVLCYQWEMNYHWLQHADREVKVFQSAEWEVPFSVSMMYAFDWLQSRVGCVSEVPTTTTTTTEEPTSTTEELTSTTEELSSTAEELSSTAEEQTTTTTEELSSTAEEQTTTTTEELTSTTEEQPTTTEELTTTTTTEELTTTTAEELTTTTTAEELTTTTTEEQATTTDEQPTTTEELTTTTTEELTTTTTEELTTKTEEPTSTTTEELTTTPEELTTTTTEEPTTPTTTTATEETTTATIDPTTDLLVTPIASTEVYDSTTTELSSTFSPSETSGELFPATPPSFNTTQTARGTPPRPTIQKPATTRSTSTTPTTSTSPVGSDGGVAITGAVAGVAAGVAVAAFLLYWNLRDPVVPVVTDQHIDVDETDKETAIDFGELFPERNVVGG